MIYFDLLTMIGALRKAKRDHVIGAIEAILQAVDKRLDMITIHDRLEKRRMGSPRSDDLRPGHTR